MTANFSGFREATHLSITFSLYRFEFHKKTLFFTVLNMSNLVLTKHQSQEVVVYCFNWKKSVAEAQRMLVEVYGDNAPTDKSCREWFRRFKNGDFRVEDKPRCGQSKKFEHKELETLLRSFSDCSLTILWPRIIMAKNGKKNVKHFNYNSVAKFDSEGVGINTIILFFSDKN